MGGVDTAPEMERMTDMRVYADQAATTSLSKTALEAMLPWMTENFGNPSALYEEGRTARDAVETAREKIAHLLHAKAKEIYFTSGGTEADNWALQMAAAAGARIGKKHIIVSAIEHHAVLNPAKSLERQGFRVTYLPVTSEGLVLPETLEAAICPDTALVSVMYANNEVGTIQPVEELAEICRMHGVWFHTDAVQAAGHVEIDLTKLQADFLSVSAHKFHGPKGCGFLYVKNGFRTESLLEGGAQEKGKRAGTENVPGIVGMAAALEEIPDLADRTWTCSGSVQMGDETIICSGTHGEQDIASAFANSCNVAFAQIAQELGPGTLEKYTEQAGLTGSYSISGLPTAKGSFDFDNITDGQLGWAGVGQYHDQVNPAALMIYMGAIANGGKAAEPYLILRTESALGLPSLPHFTTRTGTLISADTAAALADLMANNVTQTYGASRFPNMDICAKSGTAEVGEGQTPHAWFAGFLRGEETPYAFVVLVENGGGGSSVAGGVAAKVLDVIVNGY